MATEWIAALAVFALGGIVCLALARVALRPRSPGFQRIRVDGAYQPAEVHVPAGSPTRMIFRREETSRCSEVVVFPDFGISVMLPPFEDVPIDLPPSDPGEYPFTCDMQMLRGVLVVDAATAARPTAARRRLQGAT